MTSRQKLRADTAVFRADGLVAADMDGQRVMMSVEDGKYRGLDLVGSLFWDLIERPLAIRDLVAALLTEYKVEEEQCRTGVSVFLDEMIEEGVVFRLSA